jgi:hypothetical protein
MPPALWISVTLSLNMRTETETETNHKATPTPGTASSGPDSLGSPRLQREWKTVRAMVACYCRDQHGAGKNLCSECHALLSYATVRLERCRFGAQKPTCANCPIHCYQPQRREQMKAVMRYAGPRMLWQHPILTLLHIRDGYRRTPSLEKSLAIEPNHGAGGGGPLSG